MQSNLRGHDVLGRYGGDEFVLLTEHAAESDAVISYERVRAASRTTRYHEGGERIHHDQLRGRDLEGRRDRGRNCSRRPTQPCIGPRALDATASALPVDRPCRARRRQRRGRREAGGPTGSPRRGMNRGPRLTWSDDEPRPGHVPSTGALLLPHCAGFSLVGGQPPQGVARSHLRLRPVYESCSSPTTWIPT